MEGKRGRGRPRQKLMDWMMEDIYENLKEKAQKAGGVESMDIWTFGQKTYNLKKEVTSGYVDMVYSDNNRKLFTCYTFVIFSPLVLEDKTFFMDEKTRDIC